VLQAEQISVSFGGVQALGGVSVDAPEGTVTGLIGPNGAGKTTMFNVITGFQRPTRGSVSMHGRDITGLRPHTRARLGLGRTFQRLELFGSLSARENVLVGLEAWRGRADRGGDGRRRADEIIERVGLQAVADRQADTLSTGMARLVEVGRALATRPTVLLLDEPSSGLDQGETDALGGLLAGLAAEGMAVLLVEHDVELVMRVCSRVHVLDFGQMIAVGSPDEVQADPRVQLAYLGAEAGPGGRPNEVAPGAPAPEAGPGGRPNEVAPGAPAPEAGPGGRPNEAGSDGPARDTDAGVGG
jgi:branched-chain amino acid transport system ATP-binding protein